jgi:hypothetical protein
VVVTKDLALVPRARAVPENITGLDFLFPAHDRLLSPDFALGGHANGFTLAPRRDGRRAIRCNGRFRVSER